MQQIVVVLLVGLAASAYGLDLSHAAASTQIEPRVFNILSELYTQVLYPPLNHIVTSLAMMGAQVLAGISQTGLPTPNGRTLHPSDAQLRSFWDSLWDNAVKPPIENALSGLSLMLAQVLAGVGTNGINLGKRDATEAEMRAFGDAFTNAMSDVFANVFQKPLENALQGGALMLAQVLAGIGTNGINLNNLVSGIGKRDLADLASRQAEMRGIFDSFGDALLNGLNGVWTNVLQQPIQGALQSGALMAAQLLAGIGTNGINLNNLVSGMGKRDLEAESRGIFDNISNMVNEAYQNQVKPVVEGALNNAVLSLAGILANFSQGGFGIGRR